ncbi:MAG: hypothetical protein EXS58_01725 [Candidatus Latescibacteria bacterium]|nr:hypothetical protein [Candidatus Latescibacterota bacterium]
MKRLVYTLPGFVLLLLCSCDTKLGYRHFAGPIVPASGAIEEKEYVVGDDRSITFLRDRLEVTLVPLTAEVLNRQFSTESTTPKGFRQPNPYAIAHNPYTYGDWKPPGEEQAPERFTVFLLRVKNYAYPKVKIDPANTAIIAPNGRRYQTLSLAALVEYYLPYAIAYAGNSRAKVTARRDLLRKTLYDADFVFSGQEKEGYLVFPALDRDTAEFEVRINEMTLRFDYKGEPVDTVDIPYKFQREVYMARRPRTNLR